MENKRFYFLQEMAVKYEIGLSGNLLKLESLWNKVNNSAGQSQQNAGFSSTSDILVRSKILDKIKRDNYIWFFLQRNVPKISESEYEKNVLGNLRREEERKRIIAQMEAEDAENINDW